MVATNYNTATSVATIAATAADGSATVVYTLALTTMMLR